MLNEEADYWENRLEELNKTWQKELERRRETARVPELIEYGEVQLELARGYNKLQRLERKFKRWSETSEMQSFIVFYIFTVIAFISYIYQHY